MAEYTVFIIGKLGDQCHEVACTSAGMTGPPSLTNWVGSVLAEVPYTLATIRSVVAPQLPTLFDTAYTVQDYADTTAAPPPVISHLVPEAIAAGGADVTLHVYGAGFTPRSQILFNGGPEVTTFVSTRELTTVVSGATATTPGQYPVEVMTAAPGGGVTSGRWFYVLAPTDITIRKQDASTLWEVPA